MKCTRPIALALLVMLPLGIPRLARAEVKPNGLFSNGMVLQQDKKLPVWGTADNGEKVTVRFMKQEKSVVTKDGMWMVTLDPVSAGGPYKLEISGNNKIEINDVLVGEVWLASGQSNMQWSVNASADPDKVKAAAKNPMIRLFTVTRRATPTAQTELDPSNAWSHCDENTVAEFTAVGYHFGKELQSKLNVPVGIISTNYGGTPAEAWTSRKTLEIDPGLKDAFGAVPATDNPGSPGGLHNAMIRPLIPFAIRGAIWYQGESNAGRAYQYRTLFNAMIEDWRADFGQGEFPFLLVQLAPFTDIKPEPGDSDWAELREAQLLSTQKLKNVGMAVITDLGDEKDIHPKQKAPVGERLALAARAIAYGEKVEYSGPVYESMEVKDNKIILSFTHVGAGLAAKDGDLKGFAICGADKKFVNAYAEISGDKVVVYHPEVKGPVAVRFGWANFPVVNLWNKDGLPATPFRTDDFPGITKPKDK